MTQLLGASRRTDSISVLSVREKEVLSLMAEGRSNAAIADALVISEGAVEKHVANIFTKFDLPVSQSDRPDDEGDATSGHKSPDAVDSRCRHLVGTRTMR